MKKHPLVWAGACVMQLPIVRMILIIWLLGSVILPIIRVLLRHISGLYIQLRIIFQGFFFDRFSYAPKDHSYQDQKKAAYKNQYF